MSRMHRDDRLMLIMHYGLNGDYPLMEALKIAEYQRTHAIKSPGEVVKATLIYFASKYRYLGMTIRSSNPIGVASFGSPEYIDKLIIEEGWYELACLQFRISLELQSSTIKLYVGVGPSEIRDEIMFDLEAPYNVTLSNYRPPSTPMTLTVKVITKRMEELIKIAHY